LVYQSSTSTARDRFPADVAHPSRFRSAAIAFALETSLTLPGVSKVGEEGVFGHLDGLALVLGALETSLTLPVIFVVDERMLRDLRRSLFLGHLDGLTLVLGALETSLTLPAIPPGTVSEEGVFGHLDGLALVVGVLETSLTLPGVSIVGEEGVFGHLDGLTLVVGALETSLTLPGVSIGDIGMLRYLRRFRSRT
jgi:hypothetical protein